MFKNQLHIALLISKKMRAELSVSEHQELEAWLNESRKNRDWAEKLTEKENLSALLSSYYSADEDAIWNKLLFKIAAETTLASNRKIKVWRPYRIAVAAAVVFMLSIGSYFYYRTYFLQPGVTFAKHDLAPGRSAATLTLGDGRKIRLSETMDGELAHETGIRVMKNKDGQLLYEIIPSDDGDLSGTVAYHTLSTAKGETYQVLLPDKSVVWLNAASSLRYPASFAGLKSREVSLEGEAYFEIAHQAAKPFIIRSRGQVLEDLGTAFNLSAYADEPNVRTTLVEGSVKIIKEHQQVVLKPGEQAVNSSGHLLVTTADLEEAVAWKNGDFNFRKGDDFQSAMRKIARWYDVSVVYEVEPPANIDLGGWISRKNNISKVLNLIESAVDVNLKLEGRRITVTK